MKKLAPALALIILALCIFGCTPQKDKDALPTPVQTDAAQTPPVSSMPEAAPSPAAAASESIDYAASVNPSGADTAKQEVTVKSFVDGDTVHFLVPESIMPSGVLKARFIGIDTPESTGKIEEYGKAASKGKAVPCPFHNDRIGRRELGFRLHRRQIPCLGVV